MTAFFLLFSGVLILSSIGVILLRNPIYSVLCLIMAFFNAAGIFILLGAEFLAMLFIIVYVGAVAVLFLFIVMMLDLRKNSELKGNNHWFALVIASVFLAELITMIWQWNPITPHRYFSVYDLGTTLYTDYFWPFQMVGLLLFVTMVGAIVISFTKKRRTYKHQNVREQRRRRKEDTLHVQNVQEGQGIPIPSQPFKKV